MEITPILTKENYLTTKLKFKATKKKISKQNPLLKSMFSLQELASAKKTLIAGSHLRSPSAL